MQVAGTFSVTGVSAPAVGEKVTIQIDFGTGSVDIQSQLPNGNWINVLTVTADYHGVFDGGPSVPVRLNCSAVSSPIAYALTT